MCDIDTLLDILRKARIYEADKSVAAATVRVAQQKGSENRVATLQVCVSLDGSKADPKPRSLRI